MNVPVRRTKVASPSGIGCGFCKCLHLGFLHSSHGMFKIIEMILGGLCQTMLMNFGPAQAQLIGMSFYSLLSANAAATSGVTLLLICYIISENSYHLIKTSIFEIIFNLSAAFSYLSASTFLSIAVNLYLYPVYLVTMGFISYPAMIAAYLVSDRKKKHKKKSNHEEYFVMYGVLSTPYRDRLTQKIINAKKEIITTDIFTATKSSIEQSLTHLSKNHIEDIVCYGLGNFSECKIALYQLGLLLALQQCYDCEVMLYDPQFKELEEEILMTEKCKLIAYNEKGKRKVDKTTLFFLPHCPNKLFNNIILANWGLSLHNCVIIANRFSEIMSGSPDRELIKHLPYLFFIGPSMVEIEIANNFKYLDVFNDMAVHCFPIEKLLIADEQLWKKTFEETEDESLELITKSVKSMKLGPSFPL